MHQSIRNEIHAAGINRINDYLGFYGAELEISIASEIYNIKIATYQELSDNNGYSFIRHFNNSDNSRHLLILTNINNMHYILGYYNPNKLLDLNYYILELSEGNSNNHLI